MSILLQQKNVGDYSYMSSPNIYYRAYKRTPISKRPYSYSVSNIRFARSLSFFKI